MSYNVHTPRPYMQMLLLAEDEEQVKRGLRVSNEWCREWAVEVNVEKSGVTHMRRRCVNRTGVTFSQMMS